MAKVRRRISTERPASNPVWIAAALGGAAVALLVGILIGRSLTSSGRITSDTVYVVTDAHDTEGGVRIDLDDKMILGLSKSGFVFPQLVLAVQKGDTVLLTLDGEAVPVRLLGKLGIEPVIDDQRYFRVLRVVDGDTLILDLGSTTVQVRMLGVDTPEVKDSTKPIEFFGPEASEFTKKRLEGQLIRLVFDAETKRDVYGRYLAYVYVQESGRETDVCQEMLEGGYARVFRRDWCRFERLESYGIVETAAQARACGLWNTEAEVAWEQARDQARLELEQKAAWVSARGSDVFHHRTCPRAPASENWIYFWTKGEAESQGLRHHGCEETAAIDPGHTENGLFVSARGSEVFHKRECSRAPAKNRIYFESEEAARAIGLRPHTCVESSE